MKYEEILDYLDDAEGSCRISRGIVRAVKAHLEMVIAERDALRTGDTCARQCEGTAYRIEGRRLRSALQRLTTALGELPDWESDELHKAYAEAMALLTPNASVSGAELAERPTRRES